MKQYIVVPYHKLYPYNKLYLYIGIIGKKFITSTEKKKGTNEI